MESNNKSKFIIPILLLIIAITISSFFAISQKESYHCDEIFTFGLSNSSYIPFWSAYTNESYMSEYVDYLKDSDTAGKVLSEVKSGFSKLKKIQSEQALQSKTPIWKTADDLKSYVEVSEDGRFDYLGVIYNQYADVHPPFYYYFIHTVSSFFPDTYSDYIGFSVNLLFLICITVAMFAMLKRYFGAKTAYITVCFYTLSLGAMSMTVFFRMYTILTFWALLCTFIHLYLEEHNWEFTKKRTLALIAITVLGFYTQYYYIIFAVFTALVSFVLMAKNKNFKAIYRYICRMVVAGVVSLTIWPFSLLHIFFGYRGENAFANAGQANYLSAFTDYLKILKHAFFADSTILALIFGTVIILACVIFFIGKKRCDVKKLALIAVPACLYTAVVAVISDFHDLRYIMCALPGFAFLIIYALMGVLKSVPKLKNTKHVYTVAFALVIALVVLGNLLSKPEYLYEQDEKTEAVIEQNSKLDCVYVYKYMFNRVGDTLDFTGREGEVLFLNEEEIRYLSHDEKTASSDEMLLYVSSYLDKEKVVSEILDATHFEECELLTQKKNASTAYIFKLK